MLGLAAGPRLEARPPSRGLPPLAPPLPPPLAHVITTRAGRLDTPEVNPRGPAARGATLSMSAIMFLAETAIVFQGWPGWGWA